MNEVFRSKLHVLLVLMSVLSLQSGCEIQLHYKIEPQFYESVDKFAALFDVKPTVSVISTDLLPPDEAGLCKIYSPNNKKNIVFINRLRWQEAGEFEREQLIFHELGHCVLGLKHNDVLTSVGRYVNAPESIMYSAPFGQFDVYPENLEYYYNQLKHAR